MEYFTLEFLYYFIITLTIAVIVFLIALKNNSVLQKVVFSLIYVPLSQTFYDNIVEEKQDLFGEMKRMTSSDEELRAQHVIRILEIGAGPGNNFQFYPPKSKLVLSEPNKFFIKTLMSNQSKYEHLQLERVVVGVAEDMSKIEDNSVDALVATYVLCSVKDVNKVLKEIHRVLAPGGKYFFLEHGYGRRGFWQRWFQIFLNPFWGLFTDGCKIIKNTIVDIENCGLFFNVHSKTFPPPIQDWAFKRAAVGLSVYGTAEKLCTK